jgi:hypothetical protein
MNMPKAINNYSKEDVRAVNSWDELKKIVNLDHVKSKLIASETQRIAHQKYQYKQSLIMARAKEDMKKNPDRYADIQKQVDELTAE